MQQLSYEGAHIPDKQKQTGSLQCIVAEEADFYILYSTRYHKSHHAWRAPIAAATAYGHPVLYWFRI